MRTEVLLGCLAIEGLVILFLLFSSHRGRSANNTLETCYALSKIIAKFSESIAASNFDQLDAIVESGMRRSCIGGSRAPMLVPETRR